MKKWLELEIPVEPPWREVLGAEMFSLGCEGITEKEKGIHVVFKDTPRGPLLREVIARIHKYLPGFNGNEIKLGTIPAENWNENWKVHFKPFRLGRHVVVRPVWEKADSGPEDIELVITPKMAFGTGHHETTRLILRLLEEYDLENKKVLDAGTGSGILAIYAARRGAAGVVAFDIDPEAMENARENGALNGVPDKIHWFTGVLNDAPRKAYDVIVANINRNVLLELAGEMAHFAGPESRLILSGLLLTDEEKVLQAYMKNGWKFNGRKEEGEWAALELIRQNGEEK